jgi:hypothetical protein
MSERICVKVQVPDFGPSGLPSEHPLAIRYSQYYDGWDMAVGGDDKTLWFYVDRERLTQFRSECINVGYVTQVIDIGAYN